jgi:hypothetical protein
MLFGKPKPTVTPKDKDCIEEAFLWFEQEYTRDYLKNVLDSCDIVGQC